MHLRSGSKDHGALHPFRCLVGSATPVHERNIEQGGFCVGGISLGGILVIIGIVVAIFWSVLLGLIIALVGLIAFGGFARGRWY
jgi:hypothetical protein